MSAVTGIQWTDRTWNPVRGCSVISPGCVNCYAMKMAHRFSGAGKPYDGLTKMTKAGPQWTGVVRPVESALLEPLSWRKPARVFVNSMSDLFHDGVPDEFIDRVFSVMAEAPRHKFQILTKRAERMRDYISSRQRDTVYPEMAVVLCQPPVDDIGPLHKRIDWPLPNVWLGVSVENQDALARIDHLKDTPAAVRFISFEPLIEGLGAVLLDGIQWAIVGGESGPSARPCHVEWVTSLVKQCRAQHVAPFVKQLGKNAIVPAGRLRHYEWGGGKFDYWGDSLAGLWRVKLADSHGGDINEWPDYLQVREFPREASSSCASDEIREEKT